MNNTAFVYFDKDSEEIASIGHYQPQTELPHIEVPFDLIRDIVTGRESIRDYKVAFSIRLGEYVLSAKLDVHEPISTSWDQSIYQIPLNLSSDTADICIEQIVRENVWKVTVSDAVVNAYGKTGQSPYHHFDLYITRKDDANVLLGTLSIYSTMLLRTKEIIFKNIDIHEPASVYCKKIFQSYSHTTR